MPVLDSLTLRFACDQSNRGLLPNIGTTTDVVMYKACATEIQCAVFTGNPSVSSNLADLSAAIGVTLRIRKTDERGTLLLDKVLDPDDINTALSFTAWEDGTDQHFTFSLTATEANQTIPSDGTLEIYGVIIVSTSTSEITVGKFSGIIRDTGMTAGTPTPPLALYYTAAQVDAIIAALPTDTVTNASLLTSGTLADARLTANVALRNQVNVFSARQVINSASVTTIGFDYQFAMQNSSSAYNTTPRGGTIVYTQYNSSGVSTPMGGWNAGKENSISGDTAGLFSIYTRPTGGGAIMVEGLRIDSLQNLLSPANTYHNFSFTSGVAGYGLHDASGIVQFKNFGGSWKPVATTIGDRFYSTGSVVSVDFATRSLWGPNSTNTSGKIFWGDGYLIGEGIASNGGNGSWYIDNSQDNNPGLSFRLSNITNDDPYFVVSGEGTMYLTNGDTAVETFGVTSDGNIRQTVGGYHNFGTISGTSGYGLRDNSGVIEFKVSGGTWTSIGTGATEQSIGDANGNWTNGKTTLRQSTALTATRTSNLPAANAYTAGTVIVYVDGKTGATVAFGRTFSRAGSDTLNSGTAAVTVAVGGGTARFETNGTSNWTQLDTHNSILALQDGTDPSKQATFDLSNITTSTTRTINVPNANSTLAQTKNATTHQFLTAMSAQGVFTAAQLTYADIAVDGMVLGYVAKTANYTLTTTDYLVNCTSGTFTLTLPTAVGVAGQVYQLKNSGAGVITLNTTSSQTIDGNASGTLTATTGQSYSVMSNGTNWLIF
jgi:hypothetical protein